VRLNYFFAFDEQDTDFAHSCIKQAAYSKYVKVCQQNWLLVGRGAKVRQLFWSEFAATSNLGRLQALSERMWL
jgi:hypothetical protein